MPSGVCQSRPASGLPRSSACARRAQSSRCRCPVTAARPPPSCHSRSRDAELYGRAALVRPTRLLGASCAGRRSPRSAAGPRPPGAPRQAGSARREAASRCPSANCSAAAASSACSAMRAGRGRVGAPTGEPKQQRPRRRSPSPAGGGRTAPPRHSRTSSAEGMQLRIAGRHEACRPSAERCCR